MLFARDFQKPVLLSAQFGSARKGLQATCGNQEGAGRASILWLSKDLERDGQKGYNVLLCQHKKIHRFKVYKLYSLFVFQFIALEGFIHFIRYTVI